MGTRSTITAFCLDGKWRSIYCHWDGYYQDPCGVAHKLVRHYADQAKIAALLALGALYELGHDTASPPSNVTDEARQAYTIAMYRDKGGEEFLQGVGDTRDEAGENQPVEGSQYDYSWDGTQWFVWGSDHEVWIPLAQLLDRAG